MSAVRCHDCGRDVTHDHSINYGSGHQTFVLCLLCDERVRMMIKRMLDKMAARLEDADGQP